MIQTVVGRFFWMVWFGIRSVGEYDGVLLIGLLLEAGAFPWLAEEIYSSSGIHSAALFSFSNRMKTASLIVLFSGFGLLTSQGQSGPPSATPVSGSIDGTRGAPWSVTQRDGNSRVWQKTSIELLPSGQTVSQLHQYTELATGMHYQNAKGQWVESQELIEAFPGGAIARQGQHKIIFSNNLRSAGAVDMETPDGKRLRSNVLGLSYLDAASGQSVLIAEVKDSWGELYAPNVVIYPDAFTDFKADVRYTYTKSSFEQDIILHESPPGPEAYGLNPATTKFEVLTEFLNPPQPKKGQVLVKTGQGDVADENLDFGSMQMGRGKAFLLEQGGEDIPVGKQWLKLEGRDFLVEEVAVPDLEEKLRALPLPEGASLNPAAGSVRHMVSRQRRLPAMSQVKAGTNAMQLARLSLPARGLVLDYVTLNSSQTNYTFQGDTTYYISGNLSLYGLYGANTFEGGTVIKYATNGAINVGAGIYPDLKLNGAAYRPVIFTAKDDNSVGERISDSTGNPTNYYGNPMLSIGGFSPQTALTGLRMSYAKTAVTFSGASGKIYDAQFVNCQNGLSLSGANVLIGNALFANTKTNFVFQGGSTVYAQNTTFSGSSYLVTSATQPQGNSLKLTNCIVANVTNLWPGAWVTYGGAYNGFYKTPYSSSFGPYVFTNTFNPFQPAAAGNYYLAGGGGFQNVGTPDLDPTFLADIRTKTTYPPLIYTNLTFSVSTNFSPQAQRDTDTLDLGYHYDPLDYVVDGLVFTNAALTVNCGTAIAGGNEPGIQLQRGSSVVSIGTPLYLNWFVRYQSVQEQSVQLGGTNISAGQTISAAGNPPAQFQFSEFACPANGGSHLYDAATATYGNLLVKNCEFWSGKNNFSGTNNTIATLVNNLFWRSTLTASNASVSSTLAFTNNLVFGGAVTLSQPGGTIWGAFNNAFDTCTLTNCTLTNGYNAYLGANGRLYPTNRQDVVRTTTLGYVSGKLGNFYLSSGSPLINHGSVTADQVGLYHFTTQTTQVKETNSIVDIGYHYVAVDGNGIPIDTNGDGIPDYLEDTNGNGLVDIGETSWILNPFGGLSYGNGLKVFNPLK